MKCVTANVRQPAMGSLWSCHPVMVKVFYLGLFAAIICAFAVSYASAGPVPTNLRQHPLLQHQFCNGSHCQPQQQQQHQQQQQQRFGRQHQEAAYAEDGTVRSERSTNLSHITGSARKIQMFVKNWHLQILPDGVVNGTQDDSSDYSKCHLFHLCTFTDRIIIVNIYLNSIRPLVAVLWIYCLFYFLRFSYYFEFVFRITSKYRQHFHNLCHKILVLVY